MEFLFSFLKLNFSCVSLVSKNSFHIKGVLKLDIKNTCVHFRTLQGGKLRKIAGFPFEEPPLKIGFTQLFQAFQKQQESLMLVLAFQCLDFNKLSYRKSLSEKWLSDSVPESQ